MPTNPAGEPVTIHLPPAERAEAVTAYLEVNRWQVARIKEGLRQAEAGEFATDAEVEAAFAAFQ